MKRTNTFILLTVFVAATALGATYVRHTSAITDLIIDNEIKLDNVDLNSQRLFAISVINPSKKTFDIARVYTSCGCTRLISKGPGEQAFTLKPGGTLILNMEFNPTSMHQKGDNINHEVYILVTSPFEKEYKVKITGRVI